MKKYILFVLGIMLAFMTSCQLEGNKESYLYGKWENVDKPGDYKVYENSAVIPVYDRDSMYKSYKWGHEWDEEDRKESQLKQYGNGWYMWKLEGNTLTEVSMGEQSWDGLFVPVTLTISTLTSDMLIFEHHGRTYTFKKVMQ